MGAEQTEDTTVTTYNNNQTVEPGLYFSIRPLRITSLDTAGTLPGADDVRYHRVPMLLMLALAPLAGLAFVVFLPLIGFGMVFRLVGEKVASVVGDLATQGVRVVRPAWAPALAFLTRSKRAVPSAEDPPPDPWAEEKERELSETSTETTTDER